jgi:hypothetical protein
MAQDPGTGNRQAVIAELERRHSRCETDAEAARRAGRRYTRARIGLFVSFAVILGPSFQGGWSPWWSLVPASAFLLVLPVHWRHQRRAERAGRAAAFYRRALDRMNHRWMGSGATGLDAMGLDATGSDDTPLDHLYARDLDIFGDDSLFQYLNGARARAGEQCLADWLSAPAGIEDIHVRQQAIEECAPRLDFREDLALLGDDAAAELHPEALIDWGERPSPITNRQAAVYRLGAVVISAWTILSIALWGWQGYPAWLILAGILSIMGYRAVLRKVPGSLAFGSLSVGRELGLLALLFERFDREPFSSPLLTELKSELNQDGENAAERIRALDRWVNRLEWQGNQLFALVALLLFWDLHLGWAIERWRQRSGGHIRAWLRALGQLEALNSLGQFRYENPGYCFPEVVAGRALEAQDIGHPLIPHDERVGNDVRMGESRIWIVSGSNMSGKSTLLRAIGVNTVLALAGAPVCARSMTVSRFRIGASIRVADDLHAGVSRFYAEITQLARIVRVAAAGEPLLFLFDELFNGTNSGDRRVGAERLLRALAGHGATGFVTTHDLALTRIESALPGSVRNVHFEDRFEAGELSFDYRLRDGVVEKSNALELMRSVGVLRD